MYFVLTVSTYIGFDGLDAFQNILGIENRFNIKRNLCMCFISTELAFNALHALNPILKVC